MSQKIHISVISPVFGAPQLLESLVDENIKALSEITDHFEIILVEDGSPDQSWNIIEDICSRENKVKGVKLSRNFGQNSAITAGLELAQGDWVVVMDCDLQDQPSEIMKLYNKAQEGYHIVLAQRVQRKDPVLKVLGSRIYYAILSKLMGTTLDRSISNFGIYEQKAIRAILNMKDHIRFFPLMSQWVGFKKTSIPVEHQAREDGRSSYSFRKMFQMAFNNIIAFSNRPILLFTQMGVFLTLLSLAGIVTVTLMVYYGLLIDFKFYIILLSIFMMGSLVITCVGITGIYVSRIFDKVKDRPQYIVEQKINL